MPALHKAIAQLMEGRQERPPQRPDPTGADALLTGVADRVDAADRELAQAFARELFAKAPAAMLASVDPPALAARAAGGFGFWRQRGPRAVAVRVFTPQAQHDGWQLPVTVVEASLGDRPFIVDTLAAAIEAEGGQVETLLHPLLGVERDSAGTAIAVGPPDSGATRESFVHIEATGLTPTPALQQRLSERLDQLVRATDDYDTMRSRLAAAAAELRARPLPAPWERDRIETADFLDWLAAKSFVFLGYREYDIDAAGAERRAAVRRGSGLGMLRDDDRSSWSAPRPLSAGLVRAVETPALLLVSKTHAESPVHRRSPMDDLGLKEIDGSGQVVGVRRILGLFTSKAYGDTVAEIPLLRRRLATVAEREGLLEGSHDYRTWAEIFDSFPREELFASHGEDLAAALRTIAAADGTRGVDLICRPDTLQRGLLTIVIVPRARFSTELHAQVSAAVRRRLGASLHEYLALDERPVARLHYFSIAPPDVLARPPIDALRADLEPLLQTWDDELRQALARAHGRNETERLATRYGRALPPAYRAATSVADALVDIRNLEALLGTGESQIELAPPRDGAPLALKLYLADETLVLSEFVPVLENLGFRVLGQDIVELRLAEGRRAGLHTFTIEPAGGDPVRAEALPLVVAALHAVRGGAADNDRLNGLVAGAGLDWRAVAVLRAYVDHGRQVGIGTRASIIEALTSHPDSGRHLVEMFAAKFDPAASTASPAERAAGPVADAQARMLAGLDAVQSLAHDRALRGLAAEIAATVRTNAYLTPPPAALAFKLDCAQLPQLASPRPAFETWVHAPSVHGVHLRAGRVARGGIRASDRDDFRAEILGLMQTQVVKNAVIVPVGAKGGFVLRGARSAGPPDPGRVEAAYRIFIDALLSITDDLANGQPVPPPGQLIYDDPDPYLVVAADKGTATFSDIANAIAERRGYWLGDAFASGGSRGYDHKRLAITARGAWECARQHFRDLGRDLDRETISVAGIGDMSGDVFGNGLLRSRHVRLLAAFDHRDIFLDPDPDPERSFRERERLFALPRSRWSDYSPAALSRGGEVVARAAKVVRLSTEAQAMLGIDSASPSGEDVVRAILRLPVDLLWNGGIGTYVKASDEHHADVADPTNDAVRIDARELRALVVAEGGNLGLTQRARIEYALGGGRINTDAIDNSGGVDLSDHEVNLKIALQPLVASGRMDAAARDALLAQLAEASCEAVLAHNRSQALALGLDQERSRTRLGEFRDLLTILESEAGLDRALAALPTREALRARRPAFLGLTRPELAVLLANTKLDLQRRLLQSPLCDDPVLESDLGAYFPGDLAGRAPDAVARHPLRREIIAVRLANQLVDRMGMTFLVHAVRDTGHEVVELVRAWAAARTIADFDPLAAGLDADRERLSGEAQRRVWTILRDALAAATLWLADDPPTSGAAIGEIVQRYRAPVGHCLDAWPSLLDGERRAAHERLVADLAAAGLAPETAARLACLPALADALEISAIAAAAGATVDVAAHAYAGIAQLVDIEWLRGAIPAVLGGEDRWDARAAAALVAGIGAARRRMTLDVLSHRQPGMPTATALDEYAVRHREQLETLMGLIADVKTASQPSLPAVLVVMHELGRLARQPEPPVS